MRRNPLCWLSVGAVVTAALCMVPGAALAQPSNDLCANAQAVAIPSSTAGTLVGAGVEPGPPPTCVTLYADTPAVWYTLVGNGNTLTVETCSTAVSFDTKLHVYCSTDANPCATPISFSCVTGNDDSPTGCGTVSPIRLSSVTFCSTLGQSYYIMVSTFSGTVPLSPFTLSVIDGAACTTAATCAPTMVGACCSSAGGCTVTLQTACALFTQTFQGVGVTCLPTNPCTALVGACCVTATGACTVVTPNGCPTAAAVFQGAGVACLPNNPCPNVGSCCSTTGLCTIRNAGGCTGTSIFTLGTTTCTPNPCTALLGACCSAAGTCTNVTAAGCTGTSVFSGAGTSCLANPCPNTGACCSSTGGCTVTLQTACAGVTQTFQGIGVACLPTNPCTALLGACCSSTTGACTSTTAAGCASPSTFSGAGTVCNPSPCPDVGSCCTAPFACTIRNAAGCVAPSIFTLGATTCSPNPCCPVALTNNECSGATPVALGANPRSTCGATTSFTVTPASQCGTSTGSGSGGSTDVFFTFTPASSALYTLDTCATPGFNTVLALYNSCPADGLVAPVACNDDQGATCAVSALRSRLLDLPLLAGTTYIVRVGSFSAPVEGDFVLNITAGTALGACCCGSTCVVTTAAICTAAQNSTFAGTGTACVPFSFTVPCCRGDYNKSGGAPTVQDIFDFLSGYFGLDACADANDSGGAPTVQDIFDFLAAYFGGC